MQGEKPSPSSLGHVFNCCVLKYVTLWGFLVAQTIKNSPANAGDLIESLGWEDPWRRKRLPTPCLENLMDRGA